MVRAPITGHCAWHGEELRRRDDWRHRLEPRDVAELDAALAGVRAAGLAWHQLSRERFPLHGLADRLGVIAEQLESGPGVAVLSGLPVGRYDETALRIIWYGLGCHLGTPLSQDPHRQLMRDIRDEGPGGGARHGELRTSDGDTFVSSKARTLSNGALRFHTDRCDVVGLLCVRQAASGGVSRVASSVAVHNALLARRPDLVEVLFCAYHRSRLGEEVGGEAEIYALPVFGVRDGRFTSHYSRTYIEAAQLLPGTPRMSAAQWEALDLLHELADALCLEMVLAPGDMQFLNSHVTYHARTAFASGGDAGRLLYRLWLCTGRRPLPAGFEVLWRNTEPGLLRGGIGLAVP
ncbi:MAG: TauD/TfdA family dioxygenase [Gammaproteobacteria bacterium]|nr:TauD/TfdA family dioxygenase [Gammaproteobacteria bacterium]